MRAALLHYWYHFAVCCFGIIGVTCGSVLRPIASVPNSFLDVHFALAVQTVAHGPSYRSSIFFKFAKSELHLPISLVEIES